jgi:uncharacterized membrane protein YkoI
MTRTVLISAAAAAALSAFAFQAGAQAPAPQLVGVAKAVASAEAALGAKAFEAELDHERGVLVYEVNLVKDGQAHSADVDALTGKLLRQSKAPAIASHFDRGELRAAQSAPRTLSQTIAMVETSTKGRVTGVDLEQAAGRAYYEIELAEAADRDIRVDLLTGAITPMIDD